MSSVEEFCRLCAKKHYFLKDLFDENNRNLLKLIKDYIQIIVHDNDNLPSKICLDCEEKIITFQLFVLECLHVQETLKKIYEDGVPFKEETAVYTANVKIKTEVKVEIGDTTDTQKILLEKLCIYDENQDNHQDDQEESEGDDDVDDDDDDFTDNITIAALKKEKQLEIIKSSLKQEKQSERLNSTDSDLKNGEIRDITDFKIAAPDFNEDVATTLNKVLAKTDIKVKDLVNFICAFCDENQQSWTKLETHYSKVHKTTPLAFCLCGFTITSKNILYKHASNHKMEGRMLRKKENKSSDDATEETQGDVYSKKIHSFVRFNCHDCGMRFSSWYRLSKHCTRYHKKNALVRCKCGIWLKSRSIMYRHVQDHSSPNALICNECPRIFNGVAALNKHQQRHIPKDQRKFYCSTCNKICKSHDLLRSHEKSHIPLEERKIYHCDICELRFTTRSSAISHKRSVHDKVKSFVCDLCGFACGTNSELRQHRAIHSDEKPYSCEQCSKTFKTYSNLKTHKDTHESTSYECGTCRRVLNSRRTLRKHLLVHEDRCRYVCSYCNKGFKRRQTLKMHMNEHTGDKPLTCKWCDAHFADSWKLRSHCLRCHPDKLHAHPQEDSIKSKQANVDSLIDEHKMDSIS